MPAGRFVGRSFCTSSILSLLLTTNCSYHHARAFMSSSIPNNLLNNNEMRAIVYGGTKDRLQMETRTRPRSSRRNEVLVQVQAAGLNPVDAKEVVGDKLPHSWTMAHQMVRRYLETKIPGFDFSGVVKSDGNGFCLGDKVFGNMPPFRGTLAEYINVPIDQICFMPQNTSFVEAAALPLVGLTALQCMEGSVEADSRVLVLGASGGTGHVALQVARALGARKITAVCSKRNAAFCFDCGASDVVDYHSSTLAEDLKQLGPFTFVMDCVTSADPRDQSTVNYPTLISNHANGIVSPQDYLYRRLGGPSPDWIRAGLERVCGVNCWRNKHEKLFWIRFPRSAHELKEIQGWVEAGLLKPRVETVYDFTAKSVQDAFDAILNRRVQGKIVVKIGEEEQ